MASREFAIDGSGQQATPGVANVRDGLTIHLQNLRGIELKAKKTIVLVAAGEQMGQVSMILWAQRVSASWATDTLLVGWGGTRSKVSSQYMECSKSSRVTAYWLVESQAGCPISRMLDDLSARMSSTMRLSPRAERS